MAKYRVLLVDDQREVRLALRDAIETLGSEFEVSDVPSGEEAILELSSGSFDLLISDVRLPGITGLELLNKVKKLESNIKIILMTGLMDSQVRQDVADAGASAFFLKPIDIADFLDAVERSLGLVAEQIFGDDHFVNVEKPVESVSERLASLRNEMDAISAVLLDGRGRVLARAGDLPDASIETALFPALMAAYSASEKVAKLLHSTPPNDLMYFAGSKYDVFLAHVGESYALLVAGNPNESSDQVLESIKSVHDGLRDLVNTLAKMGVRLKSDEKSPEVEPEIEEEIPDAEPEIEALFQGAEADINLQEVDAFWDTASLRLEDEEITNADALTYEQARRLGLTPDDEGEKD
ncbi:MAG: response regulator [Anaerolineales bacterium]|nr:response regulator [Chloroflexota bacterium]MBL6980275.1 response regulator [Anaerolineales bacterium]